jgi:hypothetical protein
MNTRSTTRDAKILPLAFEFSATSPARQRFREPVFATAPRANIARSHESRARPKNPVPTIGLPTTPGFLLSSRSCLVSFSDPIPLKLQHRRVELLRVYTESLKKLRRLRELETLHTLAP